MSAALNFVGGNHFVETKEPVRALLALLLPERRGGSARQVKPSQKLGWQIPDAENRQGHTQLFPASGNPATVIEDIEPWGFQFIDARVFS